MKPRPRSAFHASVKNVVLVPVGARVVEGYMTRPVLQKK